MIVSLRWATLSAKLAFAGGGFGKNYFPELFFLLPKNALRFRFVSFHNIIEQAIY